MNQKVKVLGLGFIMFATSITSIATSAVFAADDDIFSALDTIDTADQGYQQDYAVTPSRREVQEQFNILNLLGAPFGWQLFYDISKITYFVVPSYHEDVYKILGGTNLSDRNVTTQLFGGNSGKFSMKDIDTRMGVRSLTVLLAIVLTGVFLYTLWNIKMGESKKGASGGAPGGAPGGRGGPPSEAPSSGGGQSSLTFGDMLIKLNEMIKMSNKDPELAKIANILRWVVVGLLILTISIITLTLKTAMDYLSNLKPVYYIISAGFIIMVFYALTRFYIKTGFSKLYKFITNVEELNTDTIITEVFIKAILVSLGVVIAAGGIQILALLISSS